jgi:predicted phage tail protein
MRLGGRTESTAELAGGIVEDAQRLVRLEVQLAKTELKEMALRNAVAAGFLLVTAALAFVALLIAGPLALVLLGGHWWWALVWLGACLFLGAVFAVVGVKLLKVKPQRTIDSMQETKEWFSDLTSSLGK